MSRIGRMPVEVPSGVEVKITGNHLEVKGPRGEMSHTFPPVVQIALEDGVLKVQRASDEKFDRSMHGTARSLVYNMVVGVSEGFLKELEIRGVGYRAEMQGKNLVLNVGYSHPVTLEPPPGIEFETDNRGVEVKVRGHDKQAVGQVAAEIRKIRSPEPYKGKGIRYKGEYVRQKAGKAGKAAL